jgi:hypothetical protein
VQIKNRIKNKRLARCGRLALRDLLSEERKFLAGFLFQDSKTRCFDVRNDTLGELISNNIIFPASNIGPFESSLYNMYSWAWKELKMYPELLEPELSDLMKNVRRT